MYTKQYNNFVGYGNSKEEALNNCIIISVLNDICSIKNFEGLEDRRLELSPWAPKSDTLHIKNVGYIRCVEKEGEKYILLDNHYYKIYPSLFETLYKTFKDKISIMDLILCSYELQEFFKENGVSFKGFSTYPPIILEDVYLGSDDINCTVLSDNYSLIFYNTNKVSVKHNSDELYWSCSYNDDDNDKLDFLYYIAYTQGYKDIDNIFKGR